MLPRSRYRRGPAAALVAASFLLVVTAQSALGAPSATAQPPGDGGRFSTSFETGQPQPDWVDTVDTDRAGDQAGLGCRRRLHQRHTGQCDGQGHRRPGQCREQRRRRGQGEPGRRAAQHQMARLPAHGLARIRPLRTGEDTHLRVDVGERRPRARSQGLDAARARRTARTGRPWTAAPARASRTASRPRRTTSPNTTAYAHYRLEITANGGAPITQLADIQFSNGDTSTPVPPDMRTTPDRGPGGSPTAKANAGFTGKRALRYAGTHKAKGRAYSYNKVFDVNSPSAGTPNSTTRSSRR